MLGMQGWQIVIVAAVILLLFGAKRLPQMARGLGQSLKIFKAETKGLIEDDSKSDSLADDSVASTGTTAKSSETPAEPTPVEPTKVETPADRANESSARDA
ncbi:Sec-independent protein translocase subunit TatA [Phytoactinopolyspora halotolerans]|uniref:Sec-independent protein translocase protein TatA n=1 Tax=Phytoactinopolyspora halotolerans TaxID=1981512 RepID=A0A6L9SEU5_9ACTN|nr:Sec-independent protein translocase subunit TatA [Phytoactinopolyspora halotolerans]NEE03174.1 Sec-independent protein translocase subunit TatA [Phytoactinopolyspora halotolerans]